MIIRHHVHPDAARALREFAAQVINVPAGIGMIEHQAAGTSLSPVRLAAIDVRVAELRVLADQTALNYWRSPVAAAPVQA